MQTFTGWQYLLIDVANQYGLDKETFDNRIIWTTKNLADLEVLAKAKNWKEKPLYLASVMALREAQQGRSTGHLIGFDAVCSGMQIMSALTGCEKGAKATGLIDTGERPDAYAYVTDTMSQMLGKSLPQGRSMAKEATMTCLYGSKKEPENIFGKDTEELNVFYKALYAVAPGACHLLDALINSWNSFAPIHQWVLPDGFNARCKVYVQQKKRIEVDELGHSRFEYIYYENEGEKRGLKNAANVVHSIDAYILRSLIRRCNYDADIACIAVSSITQEMLQRSTDKDVGQSIVPEVQKYIDLYTTTGMADISILEHLTINDFADLSSNHLRALNTVLNTMLTHHSFPIVTIHDDFKCHPNNMNQLRFHYKNILSELANSTLIDAILSDLAGYKKEIPKLSHLLAQKIEKSNYALS